MSAIGKVCSGFPANRATINQQLFCGKRAAFSSISEGARPL
jgi:hypothetical protein